MHKKKLFIVIFGGYQNNGFEKLKKLRDYLRAHGYSNTNLVTELKTTFDETGMDEDAIIARKSQYWVIHCQVALFVFCKDVPYNSATVEMTIRLTSDLDHIKCSSFLIDDGMSLSVVERGFIKNVNQTVAYYDSEKDLQKLAEKSCLHHTVTDKCHEMNF